MPLTKARPQYFTNAVLYTASPNEIKPIIELSGNQDRRDNDLVSKILSKGITNPSWGVVVNGKLIREGNDYER